MTYAIDRYPVHLIDIIALPDERRIRVRPTLPQDIDLQRAFFRELSGEARHSRFMTRWAELPPLLAERFANIDYQRHMALIAEVIDDGREQMIAEARYVRDIHDPTRCELALAVADAWRGLGLAQALLGRLEGEAAACGVRTIYADTLISNQPMISLAASRGYLLQAVRDPTLARLEKALLPGALSRPAHALAA